MDDLWHISSFVPWRSPAEHRVRVQFPHGVGFPRLEDAEPDAAFIQMEHGVLAQQGRAARTRNGRRNRDLFATIPARLKF
ncbi:MAG: hypothetical protein ACLSHC_02860 [Bilophila wadsworthia]